MSNYDALNEPQRQAVFQTEGPVLILAGAGSGKTRVLTHRAAYLIEEKGVSPYHIMAITFTNKAAGEMWERISHMAAYGAEGVWVTTFHATCVRILRRHIGRLGFETNFTIYDADDQKALMKEICKRLKIDTKVYKEKMFLQVISSAKDEMTGPEEFALNAGEDYALQRQAQVYQEYQMALKKNNALDFDDLIFYTVELLRSEAEVRDYYQERFQYIMVDEYQDTNTAQFQLIYLLAGKYRNLCVVGDDDQSIYKFRGANIYNILNFEKYFPEAVVIKLEQNYRSVRNILEAANQVISHNYGRKEKKLWTENEQGDKIAFHQFENGYDEADYVARDITEKVYKQGYTYKDCAVLYRTNAQSRLFEEKFIVSNIPYKIIGGVNFYARKEIKDMLSYLKTIDNASDDLAVRRIINVPKRGIGATTLNRVQEYALAKDISFYEALKVAEDIPSIGKASAKIRPFVRFIQVMRSKLGILSLGELFEEVLETTGYVKELEAEGTEEAKARIENIDELVSKLTVYEETAEEPTLSGFLEEVALVADIDSLDAENNHVVLMTLHSAKGLEFPNVYLAGMEDGLFPSYMSIVSDSSIEDVEEERRLAYVGITRAKEHLSLSCARQRMIRGETRYNLVSRFVKEIEADLFAEPKKKKASGGRTESASGGQGFSGGNRAFGHAKELFHAKPMASGHEPRNFGSGPKEALDYGVGDCVRHIKFGEGTVTQITEGGRDYEVTVEFDSAGVKKMFAMFAKLKKV
ncbi:MAG: UvrD-helicase domain-containing protein [Lachnospiraceae bacterium]|nr:UvrD-helicase domain-containing protein [Lachnospiraceae bacterium]